MFNAIYLSNDDGQFAVQVRSLHTDELIANTPQATVDLAVDYSTINYKDALAISNAAPVVRKWPMVAGIDCAGTVTASSDPRWTAGDAVILNGWGAGETAWGGLAQRARVKGDWLIRRPQQIDARQSMAIGTAGYTAALSVLALQQHRVMPDDGEILVTGASGGVGSISIALLAALGYRVTASTGKLAQADYLKSLGAYALIDRNQLSAAGKPLQKERWAGAIDSVGSYTLVNACAQMRWGGVVAACGLAAGMDFPASVAPFILRGVTLAGIDSVMAPRARREQAWQLLADALPLAKLIEIAIEISLGDALSVAADVLAAKLRGRVVVNVNDALNT